MANMLLCCSFINNNNINFKNMNNFTNTIELEYKGFILEVIYDWRKGNAGDYFNSPEPNEIDIKKVELLYYITEENNVIDINKNITNKIDSTWEEKIIEEIEYDVDNFT